MERGPTLRTLHVLLLATALLATTARAGTEGSLRCPGGIVSVGDLELDLLGKCGEPALREVSRREEAGVARREPVAPGGMRTTTTLTATEVERWTYDFGASQFIRIVTLDGGRVRAVETGGRGFAEEPARPRSLPVAPCDYKAIRVGDEAYALLARCGEPATRDLAVVERTVLVRQGDEVIRQSVAVPVEVWAYHFGPQVLTRVVELEEGKVVRVETGGHGYPR